ncbi:hypothetical protein Gotri_027454 [Gossypium trilobum]|uniref:HTH La-type RNA-binding domain-containing protein n=1 Tax=Gossypium trilobum TaxID=34281 RepID=A0A7J9FQR5_9ROSI|nr:hypothetical protein [Gossypium trilobum]
MGADTWPALSPSAARVPPKSSSDSPRASLDGSSSSPSVVPVSQGSGSAPPSSALQKPVSNSVKSNSNSTPNHNTPARQRSMKRNSNSSASNGGLSQAPPQGPVVESPVNSPSSRDHVQRSSFASQSHTSGNDQPHPRNSFRQRNGGPHPRGDGSHHQNFGGRRNQDHGNHEWNGRSFNNRDGHMQPRVAPRLMRHPPPPPLPNTLPFIAHTPMRPFGTPMGYPDLTSLYVVPAAPPESLRGLPFVAPMPPMFFPPPEPLDNQLHARIVNQIDYYFSNENLIKDTYLRQNMDDQGWVPIKLIAGFKKRGAFSETERNEGEKKDTRIVKPAPAFTIAQMQYKGSQVSRVLLAPLATLVQKLVVSLLTDNIQLITDALQRSMVVEVQGDKVRKRTDWMRWIMPPSVQFPTISGQDTLAARVQKISLEQRTANQSGTSNQEDTNASGLSGRASSGDFNNQSQQLNSEGTAVGAQAGPASGENAGSGSNGNAGKRPAWNKPSNGDAEIAAVMGTHRWPALSDSAKASPKSSSDSPRASLDGSSSSPPVVPVSQGSGSASSFSALQKPASNSANSNLNLTPNHAPTRQRSMKRNSNNSASNGSLSQPPPQGPIVESPVNSPSSRDQTQRSGFASQSHTGSNDHQHPRNSFRQRNGGPHPRGEGSHHQNFGGRRNQDHGNHEWNGRNFNNRDGHMQPRVAPRLMRHPPPPPLPNTLPFIAHTPMRPFGTPMGYPELASLYMVPAAPPESLRGLPFVAPMSPMFFPAPEPHDNQLHASIVNQIDYYFSNENLIKDTYLRQNMDDQGWVPIKLIAGFKKVLLLTDNIQLITDALQSSTVVEVQGDKVRKQIDWMRWIMPPSVHFPTMSGQDTLAARVQNISLDQRTANQSGESNPEDSDAGRPSYGDFSNQAQLFNNEGSTVGAHGGPASN